MCSHSTVDSGILKTLYLYMNEISKITLTAAIPLLSPTLGMDVLNDSVSLNHSNLSRLPLLSRAFKGEEAAALLDLVFPAFPSVPPHQ